MAPLQASDREALGPLPNPLGLAGIEFVEYETARPQALGQALEQIGFRPVARHRSREVLLYRQGAMNIIVNAHRAAGATAEGEPQIAAIAFRVRDAAAAWRRVLDLGAWPVATQVEPMELNIPAIHGVGASRIYFVDRWREFSIYDVDFVPIPTVDPHPPALAGLGWFGIVQYIGFDRLADWMAFYGELFGFAALPEDSHFGVLNQGRILASPCGTLHWQLIEPEIDAAEIDAGESLHRVALGAPDVLAAVSALRERGVDFVESGEGVRSGVKGALTHAGPHGTSFELVLAPG
jgi:4-hydroxyphenylpyruvate dioxygenase